MFHILAGLFFHPLLLFFLSASILILNGYGLKQFARFYFETYILPGEEKA